MANDIEEVNISELESRSGSAQELTPNDKARLTIATYVLASLAIIFIGASLFYILGPSDRLDKAKEVFDFVKTIVPPIATLVIGFYFRTESA